MYDTNYVNSGLITGTEWDVILNTMISKLGMTTADMTNSGSWGNYSNDSLVYSGNSSIFIIGSLTQYQFGNTSVTGNNLYKTGECQNGMKYGISDIAGNLWKWTEENSTNTGSGQYRVSRGGSFADAYASYPASYRNAANAITHTEPAVGFRVVLYIK